MSKLSLRVSHKLALIAPVALLGMGLVTGAFVTGNAKQNAIALQEDAAALTELTASELGKHFVEGLHAESVFRSSKSPVAIEMRRTAEAEFAEHLDELRDLVQDRPEEARIVASITETKSRWDAEFDNLVKVQMTLGLDPESGLEGELRKAVHEAESVLKSFSAPVLQVSMLTLRRHEKDFMLRGDPKYIEKHTKEMQNFGQLLKASTLVPTAEKPAVNKAMETYAYGFASYAEASVTETKIVNGLNAIGQELTPMITELTSKASEMRTLAKSESEAAAASTLFAALLAAFAVAVVIVLVGWMLGRSLSRPLNAIRDYMRTLSEGNYQIEVPFTERTDEIGEMARSISYFREAAMDRQAARVQSEKARSEKEQTDAEMLAERERQDAERTRVIAAVTAGLENLSAGNLAYRITEVFAPEYEKLRTEFNASIDALSSTMVEIAVATESVRLASSEIGDSADDLSRRTEQQAASLEQTSAALDEITSTVKNSSVRAEEASEMVGAAKASAENSGKVVKNAISAMEKIEQSSGQISHIISVIDDIAFQTNLLALNAGVEAARAGDAGRGFAVVAQEVRELAQRSANAAKEIKTLIETSSTQVGEGVSLVNSTGTALAEIETQVTRINDLIQSIVTGAREQSTALAEINSAINQMDQMTQQNAAMVEETNAATQGLSGEAVKLESLVRRFNNGTGTRSGVNWPVAVNAQSSVAQSPARALGAKVASAFGQGGLAIATNEDNWSEF